MNVHLHGNMPAITIHGEETCKTFIYARGKWVILNLVCWGEGQAREHVEISNDEIAETYRNIEKDPTAFDEFFSQENQS